MDVNPRTFPFLKNLSPARVTCAAFASKIRVFDSEVAITRISEQISSAATIHCQAFYLVACGVVVGSGITAA